MTDSSHSSARALLLEQIHPEAGTLLRDAGLIVETADRAYDEDELAEALTEVTVLGIRSKTQITRRVLDAAPNLVAIGAFCIGTNQIDLRGRVGARASRCSTLRSRTPAAWSSWRSPRSSRSLGG